MALPILAGLSIGSSLLGSSSLAVAASAKSSSNSENTHRQDDNNSNFTDMEFSEMVKNSSYALITRVEMAYEVYIDKSTWHWFLLLKAKDTDLFFSIEIFTSDFSDIVCGMCLYTDYKGKLTYCGKIADTRLDDILKTADRITEQMGRYRLFSNNCQHFCNNILHHYGFEVYRTTIGKEVTAELQELPMEPEKQEMLARVSVNDSQSSSTARLLVPNSSSSTARLQEEHQIMRHFASALNAYTGARRH